MTAFRLAVNPKKYFEGDGRTRPELPWWLRPAKPLYTFSEKVSYEYWTKIYWATPPWHNQDLHDQMKEIYESAGPDEHVDHIVPLKHPLVCGLHVPWNLRVINEKKNLRKSNYYWPDCPFHQIEMFESIDDLPDSMFEEFYRKPEKTTIPFQMYLSFNFSQIGIDF